MFRRLKKQQRKQGQNVLRGAHVDGQFMARAKQKRRNILSEIRELNLNPPLTQFP